MNINEIEVEYEVVKPTKCDKNCVNCKQLIKQLK